MALTTVAEYKAWANITDSSLDTPLAVHLGTADAKIKRYVGVALEQNADYTENIDGTDENSITVAAAVINSITSIKLIDGDGNATHTYDATDYEASTRAPGVVRLRPGGPAIRHSFDPQGANRRNRWAPPHVFPRGVENVEFKGDVGYATIPEDLKEAVWLLIAASMAGRGRDPSLASVNLGTVGASFRSPDEMTASAYALADPWRRVI